MEGFLTDPSPLFDVRSPGEYERAHLPGALNLPLFSNAERAEVGTCYKQQGRTAALLLGLERVGPKLAHLIQKVAQTAPRGPIRLYCWRGGMRSQSVAHLLKLAGYDPIPLSGGYKRFRRWALDQLNNPPPLRVVGGFTGSGKSAILQVLAERGEPVLDLERLAHHRGSAFGGMGAQPTQEAFENSVAWSLYQLRGKRVWVEDESRLIGKCRIPSALYSAMQHATLYRIDQRQERRCQRLMKEYGEISIDRLIAATQRIAKRLGGQRTREIIERIERREGEAVVMLLDYYDRAYLYSLERRHGPIVSLSLNEKTDNQWATALIEEDSHGQEWDAAAPL